MNTAAATAHSVVPWPAQSSQRFVRRPELVTLSFFVPRPEPFLQGNIAPGWRIAQPLPVLLEQDDDGSYVASDDLFVVYGEGSTEVEALRDYVVSLIDYYELLAARAVEDDPPTQAQFRRLQLYLHHVGE